MSHFEYLKQSDLTDLTYEESDNQKENRRPLTQPMTRSFRDRINVFIQKLIEFKFDIIDSRKSL
jgi:hypothetical protein